MYCCFLFYYINSALCFMTVYFVLFSCILHCIDFCCIIMWLAVVFYCNVFYYFFLQSILSILCVVSTVSRDEPAVESNSFSACACRNVPRDPWGRVPDSLDPDPPGSVDCSSAPRWTISDAEACCCQPHQLPGNNDSWKRTKERMVSCHVCAES